MATSLPPPDKITRRRRLIKSFEAKALSHRSWTARVADSVTNATGTITFLLLNIYFFILWIVVNSNLITGVVAFDPYPFGMLTMIVSLEAIILSIFVLLSQNRAAQVDKLRNELQLQVNLIAEEEITKALELLTEIHRKVGIKEKDDPELARMLERIDTSYIERSLQKQIDKDTNVLKTIIQLPGNNNGNGKTEEKHINEKEEKPQEQQHK